jgi:hypothetical protein
MHELGIAVKHTGRDNVGGAVHGDTECEYNDAIEAPMFRTLLHHTHLGIAPGNPSDVFPLPDLQARWKNWSLPAFVHTTQRVLLISPVLPIVASPPGTWHSQRVEEIKEELATNRFGSDQ